MAGTSLQIEPQNKSLQISNTIEGNLLDSGSVCSFPEESLANEIVENSSLARDLTAARANDKDFCNEPIPVIGMIKTLVTFNLNIKKGDGYQLNYKIESTLNLKKLFL